MKLPNSTIATGKAKIQALWGDTVDVLRSNETTYEFEPVYTNVKCHFSQSSQPLLDQSTTIATTTSIFKLYVDTDIIIMAGDNLVINHKGQTFKGIAGQPFYYNLSNCVKVEVEEIS